MTPTGMTSEGSPSNDPPICAECDLPITDDSYILWKGMERVCINCRNIRVEQLRKIRQEEIERAGKRKVLNVSTLKTVASATVVQLKAREKWGRQMVYLEATSSNGARTQLVRYLFAHDVPIYIPSWSWSQTLYLRDITEVNPSKSTCSDCGCGLEPGRGTQWNYDTRLCSKCYSEHKRTTRFGVRVVPTDAPSAIPLPSPEDTPETRGIKLVAESILRTAGGGMGILLFNKKMQKEGYPPEVALKTLEPDLRFRLGKRIQSKMVDGKIVRTGVGEVMCISFQEAEE